MITRKISPFWLLAATIVVADFATKRVAEQLLTLHVPQRVIGDAVRFTLTYNTGAALDISLGSASRVVFSLVAVVMLAVLFRMYRAAPRGDIAEASALGLVAGGALGNLIDRLRSARGVVDFIDVGTAGWRFWTFNVADIGIVAGAVLLAVVTFRRPSGTVPLAGADRSPAGSDAARDHVT